jgi:hypothetical protein
MLLGGSLLSTLEADVFTLAWTHSVEHVEWQEDYRVEPDGLVLIEARVRGSGTGMEPGADAVWAQGWWRYAPRLARLPGITLANSDFGGSYQLCVAGACSPIPRGEALRLAPCAGTE